MRLHSFTYFASANARRVALPTRCAFPYSNDPRPLADATCVRKRTHLVVLFTKYVNENYRHKCTKIASGSLAKWRKISVRNEVKRLRTSEPTPYYI